MPKRISLPSSDELFAQPGPRPGRAHPAVAETVIAGKATRPRRTREASRSASGGAAAAAEAAPSPVAAPRRARSPRRVAATTADPEQPVAAAVAPRRSRVEDRVDQLQSALRDLPIDSLIDLRDGLEALLGAETVSDAEVERLLAGLTR